MRQLGALLKHYDLTMDSCFNDFSQKPEKCCCMGAEIQLDFEYENMRGEVKQYTRMFEGIIPMVKRRYEEAFTNVR